jgi:hypothetical protein
MTGKSEHSGPSVRHVQTWAEFKSMMTDSLFPHVPLVRGRFLFRGHGSPSWPLISSFDRWYKGPRSLKAKTVERLMTFFLQELEGLDVSSHVLENEVARLALAQHHGLPTRLLDWTESPYIAAFFAFSGHALDPQREGQVAVWCLDTRSHIWSREFGVEILSVPSHGNDRLRMQMGKFTLLRAPYDTLEEYVAQFPEAADALVKTVIPASEVLIALADLDVMGLNHSRIFPGIEGCARAATLRTHLSPVA